MADVGGGHWGGQAGEDAEPDAAGPAQLRVCVGAPAGPGGGQPRAAIGGAPSAGTWRRFYVRLGDCPGRHQRRPPKHKPARQTHPGRGPSAMGDAVLKQEPGGTLTPNKRGEAEPDPA